MLQNFNGIIYIIHILRIHRKNVCQKNELFFEALAITVDNAAAIPAFSVNETLRKVCLEDIVYVMIYGRRKSKIDKITMFQKKK